MSSSQTIPDSLKQTEISVLVDKFTSSIEFEKKEIYALAALRKAKEKDEQLAIIQSYHMLALIYKEEQALKYCDSIISLSKDLSNARYPTIAYLIKGNRFYKERNFKKALDNYLKANEYATKNYNRKLALQSNYSIAILRDRIGEHETAVALHRENYLQSKKDIKTIGLHGHLAYVFALANSFNELKLLDSASYYNRVGIDLSLKEKSLKNYYHFVLNEGVTLFYNERYVRSLDSINKAIPHFETSDDEPNLAVGYFYKGQCLLKLGRDTEAIDLFKRVDTIFLKKHDLQPKLRGAYEFLISHYKENENLEKQLLYIERLISLDSILYSNEIYLNKNIIKSYDIPELISEKENIISNLQNNKSKSWKIISVLSAITLILLLGFYYQYKRRKLYKQRFFNIIDNDQSTVIKPEPILSKDQTELNIAQNIVDNILKGLNKFETDEMYLKLGTNQHDLSKTLKTNANYLSKVVNHYKEKSFINYINDLRINHAMERLKKDNLFRRYTIKAIANEVGFNNSESFSKAFHKKTGIKPSYFIRELEKHL